MSFAKLSRRRGCSGWTESHCILNIDSFSKRYPVNPALSLQKGCFKFLGSISDRQIEMYFVKSGYVKCGFIAGLEDHVWECSFVQPKRGFRKRVQCALVR